MVLRRISVRNVALRAKGIVTDLSALSSLLLPSLYIATQRLTITQVYVHHSKRTESLAFGSLRPPARHLPLGVAIEALVQRVEELDSRRALESDGFAQVFGKTTALQEVCITVRVKDGCVDEVFSACTG